MPVPLACLSASKPPSDSSLGDFLAGRLSQSNIATLIDCLPSGNGPAILSPDPSRPPLTHDKLRAFVTTFTLPHSPHRPQLDRNDRVMVVLPPGPENALALITLSCYYSCAPVNANCTASELKEDAIRLRAKAVITTEDIGSRLEMEVLQDILNCEVIYLQERQSGSAGLFDVALMNSDSAMAHDAHPSTPHTLDDISLILHTSGTSGKKKVVRYSLRTLLVGTWCVVTSWGLQESDKNLNMMPLFHVGGIVRNLLAPALSGGSSIMCLGFDPGAFWSLASELGATWYYAAPTVHHAILAAKPETISAARDLKIRMICNAAGGLLPSLASELKNTFSGAVVLPSYGMTECMPIATPPLDYNLERPGCSGRACGPHLSIRDPQDLNSELTAGMTGAVCVRGFPTFDGYETSPDLTVSLDRSPFTTDGWFDSGDMGYMDDDGYLYITGRSKEIINKGGEVISPFEVEEAILQVTKGYFQTVLAFSVDHDVLQETIGVLAVPVLDKPALSLQQVHDRLKGHLHPSKWPFAIVYSDDLPKNSTGKTLRIGLAKRLGMEKLSDSIPPIQRHFRATIPIDAGFLSESIACSNVSVNHQEVEAALYSIEGVADVAVRGSKDSSIEAFVRLKPTSNSSSAFILQHLALLLPGYAIPTRLKVVDGSFPRHQGGGIDFEKILSDDRRKPASTLTRGEELVRDIISELLEIDPHSVQPESDFFLLGGNSLLLGKLSHSIRKRSGINVGITELFSATTVRAIAALLEEKEMPKKPSYSTLDRYPNEKVKGDAFSTSSSTEYGAFDYDYELDFEKSEERRGQRHPLCLVVQAIPFILFYPLKAALTWSILLFVLSYLSVLTKGPFWNRMLALATGIVAARLFARVACPLVAIAFKWIVIGKYRAGTYRMWSNYYLRWWIVNQLLRINGRGIFASHPALILLYYRLLGAKIGRNVVVDDDTRILEADLITLEDGCRIDTAVLRAFSVEREGHFRLAPIVVGSRSVINCYTNISPGSNVPPSTVYGPHASSFDEPSPRSYAAYNRTLLSKPHWLLRLFVAWPIILLVLFVSYIPWIAAIFVMIDQTSLNRAGLNDLQAVIFWFASGERVFYHALARVCRALLRPVIQVVLSIAVKRLFGLNTENTLRNPSQLILLRRYINSILLSQASLKELFMILGTHYEIVSIVYRAMGAKIGKHVYWPGSGIKCPDPELLEIGNDVVFGSRSWIITTDRLGSGKVVIDSGAMIADRVVLLPGVRIGSKAVMGSGALTKRNTAYEAGSTWIGNDKGEAVCLGRGTAEAQKAINDTLTPFGRAFYLKQTNYFVFPYTLVALFGIVVTGLSAAYWSLSAVAAAQMLRQLHIHLGYLDLFDRQWWRFSVLYGLIAMAFVVALTVQGLITIMWTIATKWLVIGKRREGRYDWDQSSYCQRWQLHLVLSRFAFKGFGYGGVLSPLNGSVYIVWYLRALGAKIGKDCAVWAGGRSGLMTEPDLVELGDDVNLDDCSVVAHINSRGRFSLNKLKIGSGCALRCGSRLLSGASMEKNSMLCEHTLLASGEIADADCTYVGWPAKKLESSSEDSHQHGENTCASSTPSLTCPLCLRFPQEGVVIECGHLFCQSCISKSHPSRKRCPICAEPFSRSSLRRVHLSFAARRGQEKAEACRL